MTRLLPRCILLALLVVSAAVVRAEVLRVDTVARAPQARYPMSVAFAPNGSGTVFFAEKNSGCLRMIARGVLRADPMATFPVESEGDQGFLGLAIDPLYPDSPFVYVLYVRALDRSTVVERYRDSAGVLVHRTPLLIAPRIDDRSGHLGGDIAFGPDGMLYVAIGDHQAEPERAQDMTGKRAYWGKILRLAPDGSIPRDNPDQTSPVWARGLCNPTSLTFDPVRGELYCTDAARDGRNEINRVVRGGNLGWPDPVLDSDDRLLVFDGETSPALTSVAWYGGDAFPRLRGTLLVGGHRSRTLLAARFTPARDSLLTEAVFTTNAGFADVQVGPDGTIYLINGPFVSSRILRLVPVAPRFVSVPPTEAVQESLFTYTPEFEGTPPALAVLEGPEGLSVDSVTWSVRWRPTNRQALEAEHRVTLRAENGAGADEQTFTLHVRNRNDSPLPFALLLPEEDAYLEVPGDSLVVSLSWEQAEDPDGDTLWYVLEVDTSASFVRPIVRDTVQVDSAVVTLPPRTRLYYWRVRAGDGVAEVAAENGPRRLVVAALGPSPLLAEPAAKEAEDQESVLGQNFPNPFNPQTSIQYTVPRAGRVRLSVFNLLGQEVAIVLDAEQSVGVHTVEFDKADLPSGIYFYRLQGPGFFETKKMIVAK